MLTWHLVLVYIWMLLYMYIAPGQGQVSPWGQMLMSTESPYHFAHLLQVLKQYFFHVFPHVYRPRQGKTNPWVKILMSTERPYHFDHLLQVLKKIPLNSDFIQIFFFFFFFFHVYIAPGQGNTMPWGQNFDPNRKALSRWPFVANLKKSQLLFYTHF